MSVWFPPAALVALDSHLTTGDTAVVAPAGFGRQQLARTWLANAPSEDQTLHVTPRASSLRRLRHLLDAPPGSRHQLTVWVDGGDGEVPLEWVDEVLTLLGAHSFTRALYTGSVLPPPVGVIWPELKLLPLDELRWTLPDLTDALLRRHPRGTPADAERVLTWSDGWPLAVTAVLTGLVPFDRLSDDAEASNLVEREVLAGWPEGFATRLALLRNADTVDPDELARVLGTSSPREVLAVLGVPGRWTSAGNLRLPALLRHHLPASRAGQPMTTPTRSTKPPTVLVEAFAAGDLTRTMVLARRAAREARREHNFDALSTAKAYEALVHVLVGRIRRGATSALSLLSADPLPDPARTAANIAVATTQLLRGALAEARRTLEDIATAPVQDPILATLQGRLEVGLALRTQAVEEASAVQERLLAAAPRERFARWLAHTSAVEVALATGSRTAATKALARLDISAPDLPRQARAYYEGRVLLLRGQPAQARVAVEQALDTPTAPLITLGLLTVAAMAASIDHSPEAARSLHQRAGAQAADMGLLQPEAWHTALAVTLTTHSTITKSEREILTLLATDLPLAAIAARRGITLNTLKSHTRSIYRKLGVSTRAEAVGATRGMDASTQDRRP